MSADAATQRLAVVLIGHGAPATDCPPQLTGELMSLEWRHNGGGHHHGGPPGAAHQHGDEAIGQRIAQLDAQIRGWPRHAGNDPYKAGVEKVAAVLRPLLPPGSLFAIGYNEFCQPSIPEAVAQVVQQGAARVVVIPTMLTPGGVHSEIEIPRMLDSIRRVHPGVAIEYAWPFDLQHVAALLAQQVRRLAGA